METDLLIFNKNNSSRRISQDSGAISLGQKFWNIGKEKLFIQMKIL
jgi:hypothetical protein